MPPAIALIRGINVGATRSLPMLLLRELAEQAGMQSPRTHIQSGNLVFNGPAKSLPAAATKLEDLIESARGFRPAVITRTRAQLAAAIEANPFPEIAKEDPAHLLLMFLKDQPAATAPKTLDQLKRTREHLTLIGRELYIHFPDGIGRSKLSMAAVERAAGPGTARNWNTTLKLLAMCDEAERDEAE
jgi:uncharacterized protein (DUF1697 family)